MLLIGPLKDFFRFVAAASRGIIDRETGKIMADSLNTFGEWFFAGLALAVVRNMMAHRAKIIYQFATAWNCRR